MFDDIPEEEVKASTRVRTVLGIMLIAIGFVSIALYFGSTIFYPLLQFNEFVGLGMREGMEGVQNMLVDRYVNYLPLILFGVSSVIIGNWFWLGRKVISHSIPVGISCVLFTTFVVLMLKTLF
ncbi:MAG: hypothetical protein QXU32_00305 [Nitrososphaerales archaeon]